VGAAQIICSRRYALICIERRKWFGKQSSSDSDFQNRKQELSKHGTLSFHASQHTHPHSLLVAQNSSLQSGAINFVALFLPHSAKENHFCVFNSELLPIRVGLQRSLYIVDKAAE
jgi:hypothetical protein